MRKTTCEFIKAHRGEEYTRRTGTFEYTSMKTGEVIPSHIAEELDRLGKFKRDWEKKGLWYFTYTVM